MDALAFCTAAADDTFGRLLLERQALSAWPFFLHLLSVTLIWPSNATKEPGNPCGELQTLRGVQDALATVGKIFIYPISPFAFQGKITRYKVTLANGGSLPRWLEYNHNTDTLQGLPMPEDREDYILSVTAYGEPCGQRTPQARAAFVLHIQENILVEEKKVDPSKKHESICSGAQCTRGVSVTFAAIIIHVNSIKLKDQLYLISTMADYLHMDPSALTLSPFEDSFSKHPWNLSILAEDIRYINTRENHYIGLCWPVGFGVFAMLYELIQVLQHNVESNSLSVLLGYKIAGWRIFKKTGNENKDSLQRHKRQLMTTPIPLVMPTKAEAFTVLSTTLPCTQTIVKPSSSLLLEATTISIPSYMNTVSHSEISLIGAGTIDIETLLSIQSNTQVSAIFQALPSELSPSLISSETFERNVATRTPPISEQLQAQMPQDMHSTSNKCNCNSILCCSSLSVPTSETQFSRLFHQMDIYISPEATLSRRSSLDSFSRDVSRNLDYNGSSMLLGETAYIASIPLSSLSVLNDLQTSYELPFSNDIISLLLSDGSYNYPKLLSSWKYVAESFQASPPIKLQTEILIWNLGSSLTYPTATSSAFALNFSLSSDTRATPWLYYPDNTLNLAMDNTQENNISPAAQNLGAGFLPKTRNTSASFPSLASETTMDLLSLGLSNLLLTEELWFHKRQASPEILTVDTHISDSSTTVSQTYEHFFEEENIPALTTFYTSSPPWGKELHLNHVISSSTAVPSSCEDKPFCRTSWESPCCSYDAPLHTWSMEFIGTPELPFSKNGFVPYDSSILRTKTENSDVLQLEQTDLNFVSPSETQSNSEMTRKLSLELMEARPIAFTTEMLPHTGSHATIFYLPAPNTNSFASQGCLHGTRGIQTSLFSVSQTMTLGQTNTSPRVVNAFNWITATVGHKFSFSVPPNTFHDQEDGNTTQLTLRISPMDGSPSGAESWLQLNSDDQTLHGYPLDHDLQYSPQEFLLFVADSGGLMASTGLTIEILRPATIPCHLYTIRTKNSYFSFLRDRERVNKFFEKLSEYLIVTSPDNMILFHLKPGSTVITWYHKSFCTRNNWCAKNEIQNVLIKLGTPNGSINSNFVEAMLPLYKIDRIEDVVYGRICLAIIEPSNISITSNRTIPILQDGYSWIKTIFSVTLIVVCTIVIVIPILVFIYCKQHKKVFEPQSISFNERPFLSSIDLEMDALKSRKLPILEQEIPPSVQLWVPMLMQQLSRTQRSLLSSQLPPPPKYRLPPLYGMERLNHTHQDLSHRKCYPKSKLC